jgi:hypothetical protein
LKFIKEEKRNYQRGKPKNASCQSATNSLAAVIEMGSVGKGKRQAKSIN